MRTFVAGGSGTIGIPLVRALVEAGHEVTALARTMSKRDDRKTAGASVTFADAFDRDALCRAVVQARPTHVIHQLTTLPKDGPRHRRDPDTTNMARLTSMRLPLSNAKARTALGWRPTYATIREGLAQMFDAAA